jgi:hypothetical protein
MISNSCFGAPMKKKTRKQRKSRVPVRNPSRLPIATHRQTVNKGKAEPVAQPWLQLVSSGI